jgi:thiol peroxidase
MALVTLQGSPVHTAGELPAVGRPCPPFTLLRPDLSTLSREDLEGRRVVLNIFPSLDTDTCARSVYAFDARTGDAPNMTVVCVSADLPFAQGRFAEAGELEQIAFASTFRHPEFGQDFGVAMVDGPLQGLLARAVVVVDERGTVVHTELVSELACEADYDAALDRLRTHPPRPQEALPARG